MAEPLSRWERQASALTLIWRAAVLGLLMLTLIEARAARRNAASAALDVAELRALSLEAAPSRTAP